MSTQESEETPLLARASGIGEDFNELLREEGSEESLGSLLVKKPIITAVVFLLFCLIAISTQVDRLFDLSSLVQAPQVALQSVTVVPLALEAAILANVAIALDYSRCFSGLRLEIIDRLATWVNTVDIEINAPIQIQYNGTRILSAKLEKPLKINVEPDFVNDLSLDIKLYDVGRTDLIQHLVNDYFGQKIITLYYSMDFTVQKWGIPYRDTIEDSITIDPAQSTGGLDAQINHANLLYSGSQLIMDLSCEISGDFPANLSMEIPEVSWGFELEGCSKQWNEVSQGHSKSLNITPEASVLNVSVQGILEGLPDDLTIPCKGDKHSSVDTLISRYLNGKANDVRIHAFHNDESFLGRLLGDIDVTLPIAGKPNTEKLIKLVQIHDARITVDGEFSGELLVQIGLPSLININRNVVVGAQNVRGPIILIHDDIPFGRITLTDWVPTITSRLADDGYLIEVFFDNVPFEVLNARQAAMVSRQLMLNGRVPIDYSAVLDVDMMTPIAQFYISDTMFEGSTVLTS